VELAKLQRLEIYALINSIEMSCGAVRTVDV